eukprot:TRINITY_DN58063_c0_g1_i1.p1 TRINITY_DN58063_c0_g1~~TRINITY_DN58063_c0_g1_i1.p1  ORF type:complete len:442 (-),score=42.71 TRINITY_DN58063_c0_g1_i1:82-1407(-)
MTSGSCCNFRSPYVQSGLMGFAFLLTFAAYDTIQVFAKRLYPDDLGPNMSLCIYTFFTLSSFVAPAVVNIIGPRLSMGFGMCCYASVVVAGLIYFLTGQAPWIVLFSGCILGAGAGVLWTGQGRMILEISSENTSGKVFSVFWSLYRGASICGGLLSFTYFSTHGGTGGVGLYIIFLVLIVLGAISTCFLADPSTVDRGHGATLQQEPLVPSPQPKTFMQEIRDTLALFLQPSMLLLAPLFYTSGGNEPFILSGFTARFFSKRATGMEMVMYFSLSVVGSLGTGALLDNFAARHRNRQGALTTVAMFTVVHCSAFALAAVVEMSSSWSQQYELNESGVLMPSGAFLLWGLSDAMINTFCYWIIGQLYSGGAARAHSIGYLKLLNSAAHVVGYAILPEHRVSAVAQLWYNIIAYLLGAVGAFVVAARLGTDRSFKAGLQGSE